MVGLSALGDSLSSLLLLLRGAAAEGRRGLAPSPARDGGATNGGDWMCPSTTNSGELSTPALESTGELLLLATGLPLPELSWRSPEGKTEVREFRTPGVDTPSRQKF